MAESDVRSFEEMASDLSWYRSRLLMAVFALTGFGVIMVYSASAVRAGRGGWEMSFVVSQLSNLAAAIILMFGISHIPYSFWRRLRWPILAACYTLLALVLTPLGTRVNGANRWFRFGSFNMQPSELTKVGLVLAIAAFLSSIPDGRPRFFRHVIPFSLLIGLAVGLVGLEPDFGTAALIASAMGVLMLAGGVRIWQFLLLVAPTAPAAAWFGYTQFEYINRRIHAWAAGEAAHTNVSQLAIGSGGVWGLGLGQGPAKLDYLPEAHTDFIFAMIGQETGLAGTLSLIVIFIILVWQGLGIARRARDRFGSLLAFGVTAVIGGQALFNMGVVTGLLPPKGISLPFVSFGGSGLVVFYSMIGLMVSVTRVKAPKPVPSDDLTLKYRPAPAFGAVRRSG